MKIIVHMGQGKTGTTALQESFSAAAKNLRTARVLYPNFNGGVAHHLLLAKFGNPEHLPRWTHDRFGGMDGTVLAGQTAWNQTLTEIDRLRPDVLVLSSKYLISHDVDQCRKNLSKSLAPLSADITPVIYVRHPVDHYRSRLQQWLKHRSGVCLPIRQGLRAGIEHTEAVFSRRPEILAFDRKTLHGGDIVEDFATRFLAPWVTPQDLPRIESNVSLSAEALVLMTQLRAELG
ncbi:MAG: hypothetical protein HC783_14930 [Rhodobacteraceae bacterium]|nr:hypothetical protein [Paracoccaceae bacterium]